MPILGVEHETAAELRLLCQFLPEPAELLIQYLLNFIIIIPTLIYFDKQEWKWNILFGNIN